MSKQTPLWRRFLVLGLLGCMVLSLSGCFGVDKSFEIVRDEVVNQVADDYQTEVEFGVGGFVLGLASKIISWSDEPDAEIALELIRQIRSVQVGVYSVDQSIPDRRDSYYFLRELSEHLTASGYETIVRTFEPGGYTMIFARFDPTQKEFARELMVLSRDSNEVSLVQLQGNLNRLIDVAAQEKEIPGMEEAVQEGWE
jgi:hypothetical protein